MNKSVTQAESGNLAEYTVEELREMSDEKLKELDVTITELLGIHPEREEELDEIIEKCCKSEYYDTNRVSDTLVNLKDDEDLSPLESVYIAYAFGSVQGKLHSSSGMNRTMSLLSLLSR